MAAIDAVRAVQTRCRRAAVLTILCVAATAAAQDEKSAASTASASSAVGADRGIDEFLTSLTQMIGTALSSDARYSQLLGGDADAPLQQNSVAGRPNGRPADHFDTGRPPSYFGNGAPYPGPDLRPGGGGPQQGFLGGPPGFPGGPPGYPAGHHPPGYPGTPGGFRPPYGPLQALSTISQHDDLRCVPRLLCEVSSGTRPTSSGYYRPGQYQQEQQSSIPFLSKDALVTLLTVLNFVDDSPLLMFGRAALLGYNARGDPRSCQSAYPTCPRDPDQLINYLNNHNGGFFRFFNQQLPQYAPQYAGHHQQQQQQQQHRPHPNSQLPYPQTLYPQTSYPQTSYPQTSYPQTSYPQTSYPPPFGSPQFSLDQQQQQNRPQYMQHYQQQQQQFLQGPRLYQPDLQNHRQLYAPLYPPRPGQQFFTARADRPLQRPRILTGSQSQYFDVPPVQDLPLDVHPVATDALSWPPPTTTTTTGTGTRGPPMTFPADDDHSGAATSNAFAFPRDDRRQAKRVKMVFPDRTGTGGLRAHLDRYGNYKGVYYADGAIKFVDNEGGGGDYHDDDRDRENRLKDDRSRPSKIRLPQDQHVLGNRLPYDRRPAFQFPDGA